MKECRLARLLQRAALHALADPPACLLMPGHHDPTLVAASIAIAIIASYTSLDLTISIAGVRGRAKATFIGFGAIAMGVGIWSMHFTAMLAFHLPGLTIAYEVRLLILSMVIAIVASALALYVFTRHERSWLIAVAAGLAMGIAIAGMHYTGMAAMRTDALISWRPGLVVASIVVAVLASFLALDLARRVRSANGDGDVMKAVGAVLLGVAIVGMHYTAMAAAVFQPMPMNHRLEITVLATAGLAAAVIGASLLILALAVGGSILTRNIGRRIESEVFYRSLIENASDIMLVVNRQAEVRFASPSYGRVLGGRRAERIGGSLWEDVHPEDLPDLQSVLTSLADQPEQIKRVTFRARHADGTYRILSAVIQNLLFNRSVRGFIVAARDKTAQLELEMQVQHAQKMDAVGKLAGGIAHDFNNLLTVIIGNLQVLADEVRTRPAAAEIISEVQAAAERAATLTRQLLAFSRRQVLQPRMLQLNEVVRGVHKMIERLLGANIEFRLELSDDLPAVRADAGQVEQAILNLAVNARDAMPNGGVLNISTSYVTDRPAHVIPTEHRPADAYVGLQVTDTGSGIDKDVLDRIFEPFFTTKEVGHGTGLGLATVYGIMNQSGGYISVDTEAGRGSSFQLLFPVRDAPEPVADLEHAPHHHRTTGPSVTSGSTILLIEDEPAVRSFARRVLERAGYRVLDVASGLSAVEAARTHEGAIQLVLSDVVLPDINGREAFERISLMRHGARVLYMSGYTEDEAILRGALSSDVKFLQKPFSPRELLEKVRATLA